MLSQRLFDEINQKLADVLASSPAKDIEKNLKATLAAAFAKLDLVTREEFDIQQAVLAKTREKLTALETRIAAMENPAAPLGAGTGDPQDEL